MVGLIRAMRIFVTVQIGWTALAIGDEFDAGTATFEDTLTELREIAAMNDPAVEQIWSGEAYAFRELVYSPDGNRIVVLTSKVFGKNQRPAAVKVIDLITQQLEAEFKLPLEWNGSAVSIAPDGKRLAIGYGNNVAILDLEGNLIHAYEEFESWIKFVKIAQDGRHLIALDGEFTLARLPMPEAGMAKPTGSEWRRVLSGPEKKPNFVTASADCSKMVIIDRNDRFHLVKIPSAWARKPVVENLGGTFDGSTVAACSESAIVAMHRFDALYGILREDDEIHMGSVTVDNPGSGLSASSDGGTITLFSSNGRVLQFDPRLSAVRAKAHVEVKHSKNASPFLVPAPNGRRWAAYGNGQLTVWATRGELLEKSRRLHMLVQRLFDSKRFDLLTRLTQHVSDAPDFSEAEWRSLIEPSEPSVHAERRLADLRMWYHNAPDAIYPRLILAQITKDQGFAIRGTAFAAATDPTRLELMEQLVARSAAYLDGYIPDKNTPDEYYSLRISQHLGGYKHEEFKTTAEALMTFRPQLRSAHAQAMLFLMPRWYGETGDCARYADKLARLIDGPAGEGMYAFLAETLLPYYPVDKFYERTEFSYERLKTYLESAIANPQRSQTLDELMVQRARFALRADDLKTGKEAYLTVKQSDWMKKNDSRRRAYQDVLRAELWLIKNKEIKGNILIGPDGRLNLKKIPPIPKSPGKSPN